MLKEIKYSGYSTTPSDYEAPDGELATAVNVIPENSALHPVLPPQVEFTLPTGYQLLFLHDTSLYTHYIIKYGNYLYWIDPPETGTTLTTSDFTSDNLIYTFSNNTTFYNCNAVGNTLIVLGSDAMYYFLWKGESDGYITLGNQLPEFHPHVTVYSNSGTFGDATNDLLLGNPNGFYEVDIREKGPEEARNIYKNAVLGARNKFIAEARKLGYFAEPFFVRCAYRLYDGSLVMHSAPILVSLPCAQNMYNTLNSVIESDNGSPVWYYGSVWVKFFIANIAFDVDQNIDSWKDIIKSIDIFVSTPIHYFNQNTNPGHGLSKTIMDSVYPGLVNSTESYSSYTSGTIVSYGDFIVDSQFMDNIKSCHTFYYSRSVEIGSGYDEGIGNFNIVSQDVVDNDILMTRETMTDDYRSHDMIIALNSYEFNNRLNLTTSYRVIADTHEPLSLFWDNGATGDTKSTVQVAFHIKKNGTTEVVVAGESAQLSTTSPMFYLFHNNPNTFKATISRGSTVYEVDMKPHDYLTGSYFVGTVSLGLFVGPQDTVSTAFPSSTATSSRTEPQLNKVLTSEVNNPFIFPPNYTNSVGTGEVLGICAAVKALSQGQFGQFPLYVFTTEGVWAMEVTSTGTYSAVQPVTRDVCTNPASITSLDTSVLFATDRGIMMLSGSNSICITDMLNDEDNNYDITQLITTANITSLTTLTSDAVNYIPFQTFIKNCKIIYDYTHQRIIVYNPNALVNYAYMFSLESKKWGMIVTDIKDNINSYPEAIAINADNQAVNMSVFVTSTTQVVNGQSVTTPITTHALVMTRPLKLDAPDILKTIDTVIQRGMFRKGHVKCALYGSRDLFNWHLVASSTDHYLRGFSGTPYKYFRVALFCGLEPDESIYGCTIQYNPRDNNQPR